MSSRLKASAADVQQALNRSREAYTKFRLVPAPKRGEILRQIREAIASKVPYFLPSDIRIESLNFPLARCTWSPCLS